MGNPYLVTSLSMASNINSQTGRWRGPSLPPSLSIIYYIPFMPLLSALLCSAELYSPEVHCSVADLAIEGHSGKTPPAGVSQPVYRILQESTKSKPNHGQTSKLTHGNPATFIKYRTLYLFYEIWLVA